MQATARYSSLDGYAADVIAPLDAVGHCPHLRAPAPTTAAIGAFLRS